jgi:hypothetical protein
VGDYRALLQTDSVALNEEAMPGPAIIPQMVKQTPSSGSQPHVAGQDTAIRFDTDELDQDRHEPSGYQFLATAFDQLPFVDLNFLDYQFDHGTLGALTPELLSDPSSASATDDGLQFLNFDDLNALSHTGI